MIIKVYRKTSGCFLFFLCVSGIAHAQSGESFSPAIKDNYRQAGPAFLNEVTAQVKNSDQKETIAQWAAETGQRLPDFLSDMIALSISFQNQPLTDPNLKTAEDFVAKWETIVNSCPGCEDVVPLVTPIIKHLFDGLPAIRSTRPSDVPLQNLYEFYQEMEQRNPWGLGSLFHREPLPVEIRRFRVTESAQERTVGGVKTVTVVNRIARKQVNFNTSFQEIIKDDRPAEVSFSFLRNFPTLLHETLANLKLRREDPAVIESLEKIIALIEDELRQAHENGLLDDFTYAFLFNQEAIKNEMIHVWHPLLKDPYNKTYKTAEFYPRDTHLAFHLSLNETCPLEIQPGGVILTAEPKI